MKALHLEILSPERLVYSGDIDSVTVPGSAGRFTVLPGHAPVISSLAAGTIVYAAAGEKQSVDISKGFVEMNGNDVTVCVELAEDKP